MRIGILALGVALGVAGLAWAGSVQAQAGSPPASFTMDHPDVAALRTGMEARFSRLREHLASGAVGLGNDGMLVVRDAAAVPLSQRTAVSGLVTADNADRRRLYALVARTNGHPEWEGQVRSVFARQWVDSARPGWFYQDAGGAWRQK